MSSFVFGSRVSLRAIRAVVGLLVLLFLPSITLAESIQIHLNGFAFDLSTSGSLGKIYDHTSSVGGSKDIAKATLVSTIDFFKNGSLAPVASLGSNVYVDLLLNNVSSIPAIQGFGSSSNGTTFGIDLLQYTPSSSQTTRLLGTKLTTGSIWYDSISSTVGFSGVISGANIIEQHLPAGLQLSPTDSVTFAFSSARVNSVTQANGFLTGFTAFGTGDFNGTLVPEPNVFSLLGAALVGVIWFGWRRTKYGRSRPST